MSDLGTENSTRRRRRLYRLCARVAIALVAIACLIVWSRSKPRQATVEFIFEAGWPNQTKLEDLLPFDKRKWVEPTTIGERISDKNRRSEWAISLHYALTDPKVAALPILRDRSDPFRWLVEKLKLSQAVGDNPQTSTVWSVQMRGHESDADQLKQILAAVLAARKEMERQHKQGLLVSRDALTHIAMAVENEIADREQAMQHSSNQRAHQPEIASDEILALKRILKSTRQNGEALDAEVQFSSWERRIIQPPTIHVH